MTSLEDIHPRESLIIIHFNYNSQGCGTPGNAVSLDIQLKTG